MAAHRKTINPSLELMPENFDARMTLGDILLNNGDYYDGLEEIRAACGVIVFNLTTGFAAKPN